MEPLAVAGVLLIVSAAIYGLAVGAVGGAVAWALRIGPFLGGLAVAAAYLVAAALLAAFSLKTTAVFGVAPLLLTFFMAWLTADALAARAGWNRLWCALTGAGVASLLGFAWGLLFRLGMRAPLVVAAALDAVLVMLLIVRGRRHVPGAERIPSGDRGHEVS